MPRCHTIPVKKSHMLRGDTDHKVTRVKKSQSLRGYMGREDILRRPYEVISGGRIYYVCLSGYIGR